MRILLTPVLCLACACTGTRTGNPGNTDHPPGVVLAKSELARDEKPKVPSADAWQTFGTDSRAFAVAMYRELTKESGNLFFSPYSVSTALAMTYAGAKGTTATEMASALHFTLPQSELHAAFNTTDLSLAKRKDDLVPSDEPVKGDGFELRLVNQAWGQRDYVFLPSYLDVLAQNYGAGMFLLDFAKSELARETINDWVAGQTEQRIEDLLPEGSIDRNTALVLTNAIYFKASWLHPFKVDQTKPGTFTSEAGARSIDMMHAVVKLGYAEANGFRAVALPYVSPDVQMFVVLPPDGSFADAAARFDASIVESLLSNRNESIVTLALPKWTFESERELKQPLRALGMNAAFDAGVADLSGMDGRPRVLYISEVYHKAFIAVDEEGTEAAAATAVVATRSSLPQQVTLTFDRPFLFFIHDETTGQILFLGHLADPG